MWERLIDVKIRYLHLCSSRDCFTTNFAIPYQKIYPNELSILRKDLLYWIKRGHRSTNALLLQQRGFEGESHAGETKTPRRPKEGETSSEGTKARAGPIYQGVEPTEGRSRVRGLALLTGSFARPDPNSERTLRGHDDGYGVLASL